MVNATNSKTKDETRKSQKLCLRAEWHYHEAAGIHAHVDNRRPLNGTGLPMQAQRIHWCRCTNEHALAEDALAQVSHKTLQGACA